MRTFAVTRFGRAVVAGTAVCSILTVAGAAAAAPMPDRVCEARVIAEHKPSLSREQWLEVVDVAEESGRIAASHAAELRQMIAEAYVAPDISAWVQQRCNGKTTRHDDGRSIRAAGLAARRAHHAG